jgi:hypothetical protein
MTPQIGAGTIIKICTASTPMSAISGGSGSDSNLVDRSSGFKSFNITDSLNTVDVTTLTIGAAEKWARRFISGLVNWQISGDYIDSPVAADSLWKIFDAIRNGTAHTKGRGQVDFQILFGGAVSNNIKIDGTMIVTAAPFSVGIEEVFGGNFSAQVNGAITIGTQ